jgi:excisionase family DNA binding protein
METQGHALARTGQLFDSRQVVVHVEPRLVSTEIAGRIYGVSARTIELLIADDGFPSVRIGRRLLIPIAQADAWIATRTGGVAA